ncbi:hypothetical protein [Cupriavidus laharis]|uniref:hypothetical protein n=1 Tax=Cupriavidus laharis TaxID=151654 RepID=UPI001CC354D4|nr:hypothetical protein [Cupriavidus laharis]
MVQKKLKQVQVRATELTAQREVVAQPRVQVFNHGAASGCLRHGLRHGVEDGMRIPKQECQPVRKQKCHLSPSIDGEIKIFFPIKYLIEAKRKCHRPSYQSAWTSF